MACNNTITQRCVCVTCVHLLHVVQEVLRSGGNTVASQSESTVRALLSGVIRPTAHTHTHTVFNTGHTLGDVGEGEEDTCLLRKGSELLLGMLACVMTGELMAGATGAMFSESMGSCRSATSWRNTHTHCNPTAGHSNPDQH